MSVIPTVLPFSVWAFVALQEATDHISRETPPELRKDGLVNDPPVETWIIRSKRADPKASAFFR
jgi:hypothetical protein